MKGLALALWQDFFSSLRDLLPIVLVVVFFQLVVVQQPFVGLLTLLTGAAFVVAGLSFFIFGLRVALFPIGEGLAHSLAGKGSVLLLIGFAFALGFGTTIAEPALIAVANEAADVFADAGAIGTGEAARAEFSIGLRLTVAMAVGVALVIGVLRIVADWSLPMLIVGGYALVVVLTAFAPDEIVGVAYDSGGVTTSTVTVPLVAALGVGLASSIKGRNPMLDGFGLIAFASLTPILFVLVYGLLI